MSATIHFDEKYKAALMEGFDKASETDGLFDHSLDMEFSGVKTVHVKSLRTEPLRITTAPRAWVPAAGTATPKKWATRSRPSP